MVGWRCRSASRCWCSRCGAGRRPTPRRRAVARQRPPDHVPQLAGRAAPAHRVLERVEVERQRLQRCPGCGPLGRTGLTAQPPQPVGLSPSANGHAACPAPGLLLALRPTASPTAAMGARWSLGGPPRSGPGLRTTGPLPPSRRATPGACRLGGNKEHSSRESACRFFAQAPLVPHIRAVAHLRSE